MGIGEAVGAGIGIGTVLFSAGAAIARLSALEKRVSSLEGTRDKFGERIGDLEGEQKVSRRVDELSRSYRVDTEGRVK